MCIEARHTLFSCPWDCSILDITDASAERCSVVLLAEGTSAVAAVGRIQIQRGQIRVLDSGRGRNDRTVPVE